MAQGYEEAQCCLTDAPIEKNSVITKMERTQHVVTHKTNEYPSGLKPAHEVTSGVGGISAERLIELANAGYMPHYRIDGGEPLFKISEVKSWVSSNLVSRHSGRPLAKTIRVVMPAPECSEPPPDSLSDFKHLLQQIPTHDYQPGVYFLCQSSEVVYVGQSTSPAGRVGQHSNKGEIKFDRVYLLPVPQSELNDVESAFIRTIKPSQQGRVQGQIHAPKMTRPVNDVLLSISTGRLEAS